MTSVDYRSVLEASARVAWTVDAILPVDAHFDFDRPMLPSAMVDVGRLEPDAALALDHIRARGYLSTFGLVEEVIVPFVLDHLAARAGAPPDELRALAGFAQEELKHIALFRRFERIFDRDAATHCEGLGPADEVRELVLGYPPLSVGLLVLHVEWMTQAHYVELVRNDRRLEPRFAQLLRAHWLEESQHARLDEWIVEATAASAASDERRRAFDGYLALLDWLERAFSLQAELDRRALVSLGLSSNEVLDDLRGRQRRALWRTFLGAGVRHPRVRRLIERIYPAAKGPLAERAARWS